MPIQGRFEGGHCAAQLLALSSQSSHVDRQSVTIDIQGDPLTGSIQAVSHWFTMKTARIADFLVLPASQNQSSRIASNRYCIRVENELLQAAGATSRGHSPTVADIN
jgi:hypothetical protein